MKKTYINPEIEVVRMKMQQHLLDGSLNLPKGTTPTSAGDSDAHILDEDIDW